MILPAIPYTKLGGRKMVLGVFIAVLTTGLAAYGKFTTDVAGIFVTIYGGFAYANSKVTTAAINKGQPEP